ncbi:MAG: SpoIID/LytB domain-containing protein [Defluviitaleaceae bacterium]|nr:SpoIID/LytB domain-containing protein [Defluviitaleaceae bacterium]
MKKYGFITAFALAVIFMSVFAYAQYTHVVRVGLRHFENRDSINIRNTSIFVGYGVEEGFMPVTELHSAGGFVLRNSGGAMQVLSGGQVVYNFAAGSAQLMASEGNITFVESNQYRGVIELIPGGGRIAFVVNVLSIEEYLLGVLPSEMSPSFHPEALKAQAVASRTYTFRRIQQAESHRMHPFDLCNTTCCQSYTGVDNEHDNTSDAVWATFGLMLFYNNQPIIAQYFSSSGGATENSEDVFFEARPYARSVNEIAEHNPRIWDRTVTWAQLTQAAAAAGAGIGSVHGISKSQISAGGRVLELTLHGANGTWAAHRDTSGVRGLFTPIGGVLPSRFFTIQGGVHTTPTVSVTSGWYSNTAPLNSHQAIGSNEAVATVHFGYVFDGVNTRRINSSPTVVTGGSGITINGRGWGHGVGMSQMGAEGMAREGFNFMDILRHYYTGVEIRWY